MTPLRSHPLPLFLLSLLSPLTIAQSFTGGDLSSLPGPYGIPPSTLLEAADAPISYLAVPITGYNTSLPAGSTTATGSGNSLPGWMLAIAVSADIPLVGATDKGINRKDFMEGTALSVTPPAEMEEPTWRRGDWRVCAVVFTGGLIGGNGDGGNGTGAGTGTGGNATERNGQCGRWISQGCIQRLQAGSVTAKGNGTGTGTGGGCVDLEIPEVCQGYLGEGKGVAYEISPNTDGDAEVFFAAGSVPFSHRGNKTLLSQAEDAVWPLVLTWTHFGEGGDAHDSVGWMSCVRAGGAEAPSSGSRAFLGASKWVLLVAGLVMMAM